jgi:hypothetical protein
MKKNISPRRLSIALGALILPLGGTAALAQDFMSQNFIKPYDESVEIDLGGVLNQFDTSLRLDGQGTRGTDINLEGNGLKKNLSSFEGALTWRFMSRHRLYVDYFTVSRSGSRTYTGDVSIGGNDYPAGATVSMKNKYDLASLDYKYSFVQTPEFEAAAVLGFYGGKFTFDVNAVGNVGNAGAGTTYNNSVSTTLPLPLLGLSFDWYPDRRWKLSAQALGMQAKVGDVDGRVYNFGGAAEYMLTRNFGLGLRYVYTDIGVDVTKNDFNGHLGWRANTASLYGKLLF